MYSGESRVQPYVLLDCEDELGPDVRYQIINVMKAKRSDKNGDKT
jgi:hypothetical protein